MKIFVAFLASCCLCKSGYAQKASLELSALKHWPSVNSPAISPNGKYVSYVIENKPEGSNTLIVSQVDGLWERKFVGGREASFSEDSKLLVFISSDTLVLLKLGTDSLTEVANITLLENPRNSKGEWLAYQVKSKPNILVVRNLLSQSEREYSNVVDYMFDNNGHTLLLQNSGQNTLQWVNLENGSVRNIYEIGESKISGITFDRKGSQLAFIVHNDNFEKDKSNIQENSVWYYKTGLVGCIELANNRSPGIEHGLIISASNPEFSFNGNYIVFRLVAINEIQPTKTNIQVEVWHYKDVVLQSQQVSSPLNQLDFAASVPVNGGSVIRVEHKGEYILGSPSHTNADVLLIKNKQDLQWWKVNREQSYGIVSLKDGFKKWLKQEWTGNISISPTGKYVIYFDCEKGELISYEVSTGKHLCISKGITETLANEYYRNASTHFPALVGIAGWTADDESILIYDNYDIWQVSMKDGHKAVNITNGYGKKTHIKFRLLLPPKPTENIKAETTLLLTAFSAETKYNGFYQCSLANAVDPEKLIMGPFLFYRDPSQVPNSDSFSSGEEPLKAENANVWLVQRQSAVEAPNYFITTDFRQFKQLTKIEPHAEHNWLTTELVTWKQLDGSVCQGVLYKPEDFNPQKKYPLIFTYYQTFSYRMYEYPKPYFTQARLDIAWFTSHGYLVFTPDIHYTIASKSGKVSGDAAVNSVVSAAQYLSKRSYVDILRMGIQGHSFGGYETNYIITHSKVFAAACDASGTSDVISGSLGIIRIGGIPSTDKQNLYEDANGRIGTTFWQRPDLYIKYSPIFQVDKVITPLLIMHNRRDQMVDWGQAAEMYIAMRRLEKRVWMLQYDNGDHILHGDDAVDFTIRLQQFFDHYLKNAPAPVWMTQGIPARLKQVITGYEYDPANNCGKDCKVCKQWNEKFKKDSAACWREIGEKTKTEHWIGDGK